MVRTGLPALARATHPLPCLAVTAIAVAMALAAGVGARAALLGAAVLCGQLSVGWSNDAIDAPADIRAQRADKPIAAGLVTRSVVAQCALAALLLDIPLSLALGYRPGVTHLVAVGLAWAYNLGLKRTVASPLPYAVAFGLVPVVVAAMLPGAPAPRGALVAAAAACGVAAHFANTVGDAHADAVAGVRGLPQRLGPAASTVVAGGFLALGAAGVVVAVGATPLTVAALAVDVVVAIALPPAVRTGEPGPRAFRLVIAAVVVLVLAFVVAGGSQITR